MRTSPIRELLASRGAVFSERAGVEVAARFTSFEEEYRAVREAVGLTDFSFTTRFRIPEEGLDMLESYAAGSVASIRFGRVLHTFATDEEGLLESDLYVANDDEEFVVIGESLIDDSATARVMEKLGGEEAGLQDICESTALIGIDGYKAWAVAKDLFSADVLGLPYLSLERYDLDGVPVKLIRGGKTSEFGYLLLVPVDNAGAIWERIERAGEPYGMKPVGADTHHALRLDGRFFNIHAEGAQARDPLVLGLQWMIDIEGEDFRGREAVMQRRADGLKKKIIGVVPEGKSDSLEPGTKLSHGNEAVAEVIVASDSPVIGHRIGLALFDVEFAYSGLSFDGADGTRVKTVSMPPFTPKSLSVKLDEM
ncbi:MAG: aminomethyl transferase family protein [Deltaproteobacteria bacterium]|nr:aminomethyl transferase family protein [Deltaproteobacteria bacterium]